MTGPDEFANLQQALALHGRGALEQAESAYRAILDGNPEQHEAMHCLGVLLHQKGDSRDGLALILLALRSQPSDASRHNDLGNVLAQMGDLAGASSAFRRATELGPGQVTHWNNLGSMLQKLADPHGAESAFRNALAIDPQFVPALTNLAVLLAQAGRDEESSLLHCRAFVLPPLEGKPHQMLAIAHYRLGQAEQAAQCYRAWLAEEPDNAIARHHLAASSGQDVPARASNRYLSTLFDSMAEEFDHKLVVGLSYQGPAIIGALLQQCLAPGAKLRILDGGCGTGLCAPVLAPFARRLTGVDLSEAMLGKARARAAYDELICMELTAFLQGGESAYDLIVMADTLIYFGELKPVLTAAARCLGPGGMIAFTCELAPVGAGEPGYLLKPSGRYSHDHDYLARCLDEADFQVLRSDSVVVRTEFCRPEHAVAVFAVAMAPGNGHRRSHS